MDMNGIMEGIYRFDHAVLLFIQENLRSDILTPVLKGVSMSVNIGFLWVAVSIILLCFKKTRMIGAVSLCALTIGLLFNNVVVKSLVGRTRPYDKYSDLIPLIKKPHDTSFASGHTTSSFAAAGVFVRFFNKPICAAVIVYAFLVAFSRMYLGVHYPTDVLCGCLIGVGGSIIAYEVFRRRFDLEKYKLR